jgi:RHS repeat-associated protein
MQVDGGNTASYVYDANGVRVRKNNGSNWTEYFYSSDGTTLNELNASGWSAGYVYLNGSLLAEYENSTTYFAHLDHLGSTRLLTGVNQAIAQNLDYLPFGELISSDSGITTHKFTGDERDSETGVDHTWFRQYSFSYGRWMTPDPAGLAAVDPTNPQSWNRYAYVLNNPLNYIDPTGMCPPVFDDGCDAGPGGPIGPGGGTTCMEDGIPVSCGSVFVGGSGGSAGGGTTTVSIFLPGGCVSTSGSISGTDGSDCFPPELFTFTLALPGSPTGGGNSSAANNGTPTTPKPTTTSTLSKLKSWGKWYICENSPEGAIENWMETGATKGAIGGAIAGAGTVGVATFGVGGVPGAVLGGVVGGVVGAGAGVIWGGGAAAVCYYAGAYDHP